MRKCLLQNSPIQFFLSRQHYCPIPPSDNHVPDRTVDFPGVEASVFFRSLSVSMPHEGNTFSSSALRRRETHGKFSSGILPNPILTVLFHATPCLLSKGERYSSTRFFFKIVTAKAIPSPHTSRVRTVSSAAANSKRYMFNSYHLISVFPRLCPATRYDFQQLGAVIRQVIVGQSPHNLLTMFKTLHTYLIHPVYPACQVGGNNRAQ